MSLRDTLVKPVKNRETWIKQAKQKMDKDDWNYFVEVLKDTEFSCSYIARKMTEAGYPVSGTTISNLRNRRSWEN